MPKEYKNYGNSMVKLLKNTTKKGDKTYHNLYIQLSPEGDPIAIDLKFFNYKIKNLLLANATECEIKRFVKVSDVKVDEDGVVEVEVSHEEEK